MDKNGYMRVLEVRAKRELKYELLHVLEFSSSRKRMSVVLRDLQKEEIVLYCKGADNVIYDRLTSD
jgi:phospholipid-translocating ATPase